MRKLHKILFSKGHFSGEGGAFFLEPKIKLGEFNSDPKYFKEILKASKNNHSSCNLFN